MLNPIHELERALSFIIPRKLQQPRINRISLILEQPLRVLNKRVVRKNCPLTTVLQVIAGVQNVTTLDLNMGFETLQLDLNASDKRAPQNALKVFQAI